MRNPTEIFVAVPTRGDVQAATVNRLQEIREAHPGLPPILYKTGPPSIPDVRNLIVDAFLATDCQVLIMCDDDIIPDRALLDICDLIPDYAVIGHPYLMPPRQTIYSRSIPSLRQGDDPEGFQLAYAVFVQDSRSREIIDRVRLAVAEPYTGGVQECYAVGFGCFAASRDVIEHIRPIRFGEKNGEVVIDDIVFCHEAQQAGYKVAACWDHVADHYTRVSLSALVQR